MQESADGGNRYPQQDRGPGKPAGVSWEWAVGGQRRCRRYAPLWRRGRGSRVRRAAFRRCRRNALGGLALRWDEPAWFRPLPSAAAGVGCGHGCDAPAFHRLQSRRVEVVGLAAEYSRVGSVSSGMGWGAGVGLLTVRQQPRRLGGREAVDSGEPTLRRMVGFSRRRSLLCLGGFFRRQLRFLSKGMIRFSVIRIQVQRPHGSRQRALRMRPPFGSVEKKGGDFLSGRW